MAADSKQTSETWLSVRIVQGAQGVEVVELCGNQLRIVDGVGRVLEAAETISDRLAAEYRAEAASQPWSRSSSR